MSTDSEDTIVAMLPKIQAQLASGPPEPGAGADMDRFAALCQPFIERFLRKLGMAGSDLAECAQDVWVSGLSGLRERKYDPTRSPFLAWLFGVCRHEAADMVRERMSHRRRNASLTDACDCGREPCDPQLSAWAQVEREWHDEMIWFGLARLKYQSPPTSFEVFFRTEFEGKPIDLVAKASNLIPKQVRDRNYYMRRKLRDLLIAMAGPDSWP
jgi:RNA polymerase sigma factor (sigma-70 family)